MFKTKDAIIAGVLAGWMGNVVKETLTWVFHFMGWVRYTFVHIAAGFYYSMENIDAPLSLVTGAITDWTLAGTFGVLLLLLLRLTGEDYAIVKGIGFSSLVYVITFGIGMALDITRATLITPLPDFLLLLSHLAIGGVSGWALKRYFSQAIHIQQSEDIRQSEDIQQKKNKQYNISFDSSKKKDKKMKKIINPIKLISNRRKNRV